MEAILVSILVYLFVWPRVKRHNEKYFKDRMDDFKEWRNEKADADK